MESSRPFQTPPGQLCENRSGSEAIYYHGGHEPIPKRGTFLCGNHSFYISINTSHASPKPFRVLLV